MKKALFQPFGIKKWFVVGLTSFLAGLVDDPGTGSVSFSDQDHFRDMQDIVDFPGTAWEWLMNQHRLVYIHYSRGSGCPGCRDFPILAEFKR